MARLRGNPKNMSQGIFWIQRANSRNRILTSRKVDEFTVQYNEDFELFAFDHNGELPKKYVNSWVNEDLNRANDFAMEIIEFINKNSRFDYKFIKEIEKSAFVALNIPLKPRLEPVSEYRIYKENVSHLFPFVGRWIRQQAIKKVECYNDAIDRVERSNEHIILGYKVNLQNWFNGNDLRDLSSDLSNLSSEKLVCFLERFFKIKMPNYFQSLCKVNKGSIVIPFVSFPFDEKKPTGPNKALNRILFKKKLKRELSAEQFRCSAAIACGAFKIIRSLGYQGPLVINCINEKGKEIGIILSNSSYQKVSQELLRDQFSFETDFLS